MFEGFGSKGDSALAVAAGLVTALVYVSATTGGSLSVPLMLILPLPLMMAGLSLGAMFALAAAAVAAVSVALTAYHAVLHFAVLSILPTLVVVRQGLLWRPAKTVGDDIEWYPLGHILAWLTVIAGSLLLIVAGFLAVKGIGVAELVHQHVSQFVNGAEMAAMQPEMRDALIGLTSAMMPGIACCLWLTIAVGNGMLAEWTVVKAGKALRPSPAYCETFLPHFVAVGLAVAAGVGLTAGGDVGYVARNLALVLVWPYVFSGLGAMHSFLRGKPGAGFLLVFFYATFVALLQWALFAVAGVGLVRHWTRPRRRDASGQEEK